MPSIQRIDGQTPYSSARQSVYLPKRLVKDKRLQADIKKRSNADWRLFRIGH